MRTYLFLSFFFLCGTNTLSAQLLDSIKLAFSAEPKWFVKLNSRGSFITTRHAQIEGVLVGLQYNDKVLLGVGYNWLGTRFSRTIPITENGVSGIANGRLTFRFLSGYFEYAFFAKNNFEITIPVQVGIGYSTILYRDFQGERQTQNSRMVVLYEPSMVFQYHFLRYFSAGGGLGYRLMLVNNIQLQENFNSPIYIWRFNVYFGKIYKDFEKRRGYAR
ncbi:MAG: hypothetical protein ACXITV_09370 [Luteibaculaceae bacterium]